MRILVLGHSRIVARRVLPAAASLVEIERIDLASRRPLATAQVGAVPGAAAAAPRAGEIFHGFETALDRSPAELAWISVVNAEHAEWVERCLERGLHVVVEKPAVTRFDDAQRLVDLARRRGLCLAEATVFAWHPRIAMVRDAFARRDDRPLRLAATFSMPPFPADDFRTRRELGGGALNDLGPYAVATARLFYGEPAREVWCRVLARGAGGVDTAFSMLATFDRGRAMTGHFGFDTEYRNHLDLLGSRVAVRLNRVFSTPADAALPVEVTDGDRRESVAAPAADAFALFLRDVIASIGAGTHRRFAETLLADAAALHALRRAAGEAE